MVSALPRQARAALRAAEAEAAAEFEAAFGGSGGAPLPLAALPTPMANTMEHLVGQLDLLSSTVGRRTARTCS